MFRLFNTWREVKDVFVKPSVKIYFGLWKNDPNLPVWRRGPVIYPLGYKFFSNHTHNVYDSVLVKVGTSMYKYGDREVPVDKFEHSYHKLPGKLQRWDSVWDSKTRKKLKKWHLSWFPAKITLPMWLRFHITNLDVVWKTKWDDIRFEFPPQFSIIAFGLSFTVTLHGPKCDEFACDDHYWEALLNYLYRNKSHSLKGVVEHMGWWHRPNKNKPGYTSYFAIRPGYITPKYIEEYYAAVSDVKRKANQLIL